MPFRKTALFLVFLLMTPLLGIAENTLSLEDVAKIRIVHKKYEEAWLKGDADAVRALFTDDSVLLPPHAGKPWIGLKGSHENHKARCNTAKYRRRRPTRLHLGHR